ncbi:hypothetical protein NicSoilB8_29050 [Arthrobacter sp. NicSoilB8]|nr:hypothetical protein NicSoilB8_29050 [Arthrobacter sp. NicSoilB8]
MQADMSSRATARTVARAVALKRKRLSEEGLNEERLSGEAGSIRDGTPARAGCYWRVRRGGRKPAASACAAEINHTSARVSS